METPSDRIGALDPKRVKSASVLSEQAVRRIVTREGRRSTYAIHEEARLRHPSDAHVTVGELLELLKL